MKTIAPLYKCLCRKTISTRVDEKFDAVKPIFKNHLSQQLHLCLTTDIWTETNTTKSYLGVTIHYTGKYNLY